LKLEQVDIKIQMIMNILYYCIICLFTLGRNLGLKRNWNDRMGFASAIYYDTTRILQRRLKWWKTMKTICF